MINAHLIIVIVHFDPVSVFLPSGLCLKLFDLVHLDSGSLPVFFKLCPLVKQHLFFRFVVPLPHGCDHLAFLLKLLDGRLSAVKFEQDASLDLNEVLDHCLDVAPKLLANGLLAPSPHNCGSSFRRELATTYLRVRQPAPHSIDNRALTRACHHNRRFRNAAS